MSLDVEVIEPAGKKMRLNDNASTSHSVASAANKSSRSNVGGSRGKKTQDARDTIVKTEVDDDDDDVEEVEEDGNDDAGQTHHSDHTNVGELTFILLAYNFFPNLFAICIHTISKLCVEKRGRVEECHVAPLCDKRVKTLCGCRGKSKYGCCV
jgi:hypothetical protein